MASFGRGMLLHDIAAEEEDFFNFPCNLMSLNDSLREDNNSLNASVVLPEGGRRRPLMKITDYKIPKLEGMKSETSPESVRKRVGKGRSRIPHKARDRPLNLGLNEEFAMYNRAPCGDFNLQFINRQSTELDSGFRFPYVLKDEGRCDSNLSVPLKVKPPNFPIFDLANATNEEIVSPSKSMSTERLHGIRQHHEDQFSDGARDFFSHSSNKDTYDQSVPFKPCITNGKVGSSHLVSDLNTNQADQFQDYDEELSSSLKSLSIKEASPNVSTSSSSSTLEKDIDKNICLPPAMKKTTCALTDEKERSNMNNDVSCMSDCKSSMTLCRSSDVYATSVNTTQDTQISVVQSSDLIESVCPKPKNNLPLDVCTNNKDLLLPSSVHDWWNGALNEENIEPKLPPMSNLSSDATQWNDELCDEEKKPSGSASPVMESVAKRIPIQDDQYSSCTMNPDVKDPHKKAKSKLTSYNHTKDAQSNDWKKLPKDVHRQQTLGWGDVSYRYALGSNMAPYEPEPASGIHKAASLYGDANSFSGNCGLNAFMKPIRKSVPDFSMEDDFPALQPNHKTIETQLSPKKALDNATPQYTVTEERPGSRHSNGSTPEEPNDLTNFDQHSIVIENLPPNSENNLREFLEPFVKVLSISLFSLDTSNVAYVRLETDEHCEWLIDCFDGSYPGVDWPDPLKMRKLN